MMTITIWLEVDSNQIGVYPVWDKSWG